MSSGFIGIITLDVRLPETATPKDRLSAMAKLRYGLHERFGASVAEFGRPDTPWQASITAALVQQTEQACTMRVAELERWLEEGEVTVTITQVRTITPEDLA